MIYLERYATTEQDGLAKTHEVAGDMNVRLKVDPAQSDATRTVWVDDAGSWSIHGTGFAQGTDCTKWTEAYTGEGGFGFGAAPTWNPSVEETATIQLIVDESAPAPTTSGGPFALLTFSLVGHIGENGVVHRADGSCPTFHEDSWWSFPTSMAGGSLDGYFFTDPATGIDYLGLKVPAPTPGAPSAFNDVVTTPESEWPIAELHAAP